MHSDKKDAPTRFLCPARQNKIERRSEFQLTQKRGKYNTLVRDQFSMELPEGKLELREYAGSIGHNYSVKLNGTMIGAIVDNMDLTVGNIMFDNAFLIVYDAKYLPQLTALAVMSARELARDKDGGLSNRS